MFNLLEQIKLKFNIKAKDIKESPESLYYLTKILDQIEPNQTSSLLLENLLDLDDLNRTEFEHFLCTFDDTMEVDGRIHAETSDSITEKNNATLDDKQGSTDSTKIVDDSVPLHPCAVVDTLETNQFIGIFILKSV